MTAKKQNVDLKLSKRMDAKPVISFLQDCCGNHSIRDKEGNEIHLNTNEMDCADIQTLLQGLGNIFQSVASMMWKYELVECKKDF